MLSYFSPESQIPASHSLRPTREFVAEVLAAMYRTAGTPYSPYGCASLVSEQLIRTLLLQSLYLTRLQRLLDEYNMLFRYSFGPSVDDPAWDQTFRKNGDRLFGSDIARGLFELSVGQARVAGILRNELFSVDAMTIQLAPGFG